MRREARLTGDVVLYDEGGNWRGIGTAWTLAERGHKVTLVTPAPFVGQEIARTSADGPRGKGWRGWGADAGRNTAYWPGTATAPPCSRC